MKLMMPIRSRGRKAEQGITILLVAVCMAFIVIAFAALAVDITVLYTARAEARTAADAGALAGAKVLSVSGMTSDSPTNTTLQSAAIATATQVATSVAMGDLIGGQPPTSVVVTFPNSSTPSAFLVNPQVKVVVQGTLPAFFSKIWGTQSLSASGTAIAEAYNPSNAGTLSAGGGVAPPISPQCVKPWILPNINLVNTANGIFDPASGAITAPSMVGQMFTLTRACGTNGCGAPPGLVAPVAGAFYDGALAAPNATTLPGSCTLACTYEENIAACSPSPISCNTASNVSLEITNSCSNYKTSTYNATSCLIHSALGADTIVITGSPMQAVPEFLAGGGNLLVTTGVVNSSDQVTTSASVVTIPVYDSSGGAAPPPTVNVIGFIQAFVNSVTYDASNNLNMSVTILNVSGCGSGVVTGNPVIGDGVSPVPVRLIQN